MDPGQISSLFISDGRLPVYLSLRLDGRSVSLLIIPMDLFLRFSMPPATSGLNPFGQIERLTLMRKALLLLLLPSLSFATVKSRFNSCTGCGDFYTALDTNTIVAGPGTTVVCYVSSCVISNVSGGGSTGGSIIASTQGTVAWFSAVATNTLSGIAQGTSGQILTTGGGTGSPFWSSNLPPGSTNYILSTASGTYIWNTASLQSGATFYVSSGTINNATIPTLTAGSSSNISFLNNLVMNGDKITSLANGSAATDAAAFGQIPTTSSYVQSNATSLQSGATFYVSSGTVGGPLAITGVSSINDTADTTKDLLTITGGPSFGVFRDPAQLVLKSTNTKSCLDMQLTSETAGVAICKQGTTSAQEMDFGAPSVTGGLTSTFSMFPSTTIPYITANSLITGGASVPISVGDVDIGHALYVSSSTNLNGNLIISSAVTLSNGVGTNGQALTSGGPGTAPTWTTIAGGGGSSTTTVQINGSNLSTLTTNFNFIPGTGIIITGSTPTANNVNLTYAADTSVMLSRATDQANTDRFCHSTVAGLTMTCAMSPTLTAYTTGQCFTVISDSSNLTTAAATLNIDTLGALSILAPTGIALSTGTINAGVPFTVCHSSGASASWIMQGGGGSGSGGSGTPGGSSSQMQYNNAGAFGGTSFETVDASSISFNNISSMTYIGFSTMVFQSGTALDASAIGVLVGSLTVVGSGNGSIIETIFGSTYAVTSSSIVPTIGHIASWSGTGTLIDGGTGGGGGTPGGSNGQIQYNSGGSSFGGAGGTFVTASSITLSTTTIVSSGSLTFLGPTAANFTKLSLTDTLFTMQFFQSGVQNNLLTWGSSPTGMSLNDPFFVTGLGNVIQANGALLSVDTGAGNLQAAGIVDLWSTAGNPNYVSFNEHGVSNNGTIGFPAGGGPMIFYTGSETFGSGTELMRISPTGGLTVNSSATIVGAGGLKVNTVITVSSITVSSANVTGQMTVGTLQGASLATCGDSTHALNWTGGNFGCQNIPGGGGGSSALATALNGVQVTSPTVGINVLSPLVNTAVGSTSTLSVDLSTTAPVSGSANYWNYPSSGTFVDNKGVQGSTLTFSTATLTYVSGSTITFTSATVANLNDTGLAQSGNICSSAGGQLTTSGCNNGTLTSVSVQGPIQGAGTAASPLFTSTATTTSTGSLTATDWNTFNNKISANQSITLSGDASGTGTTAITVTNAASQANIKTITSSLTVTGAGGITSTYGVSAASGAFSTTLSIPNGTNPTVTSAGQIGIDTAAGQLLIYDGAKSQVVASSTHSFTVTISSGIGWNSLKLPIWRAPIVSSVTITEILAESLPANTTVQYQLSIDSFSTVNTLGSSVFSVLFSSASDGGYTTTSFSNAIVLPKASLVLTTPSSNAGAGSPSAMTMTVYYLENKK